MNDDKTPVLLGVRPTARKLGVGEKWLRAEIKAGRVPGIQIGSQFRVDWFQYLEQLRKEMV